MRTFNIFILIIFIGSALFFGCDAEIEPSLYDPNAERRDQPVIESINPPDSAFAIINNLTITGSNFYPEPGKNYVYFNASQGQVLTATETQLHVKPPYVIGDTIIIKMAAQGAPLFSEEVLYKIMDPAPHAYPFIEGQIPYAITSDLNDNLYVSLVTGGVGQGIKKITPEKVMEDYAPKGAETFWANIKIGPDGIIYAIRNVRAVFQFPAGGGNVSTWSVVPTATVRLTTLDFDSEHHLWAAGNNQHIFRFNTDKELTQYPFAADVRAIRIFNGYVYLAGMREGVYKIWRMQMLADNELRPEEEVFAFSSQFPNYNIYDLTFAMDGTMYIATDGPACVVAVHPDGRGEALYTGLFENASIISFSWGTGNSLFMTRAGKENGISVEPSIIYVQMEKQGAPYYGRE